MLLFHCKTDILILFLFLPSLKEETVKLLNLCFKQHFLQKLVPDCLQKLVPDFLQKLYKAKI